MAIDRRTLLAGSALVGSAAVLANGIALEAQAAPVVPVNASGDVASAEASSTLAAYISHAAEARLKLLPSLPLVNGHAATDGYTFDESIWRSDFAPASFVVQHCARVSDIPERNRFGVLPLFTLASSRRSLPDAVAFILHFLLARQGLQQQSMTFTTLPGNPLLPFLRDAGIRNRQIRLRNPTEAHAAGDGSGWFRDPATGKGYQSMSIECSRGNQRLEISELAILGGENGVLIGSGIERIAWARSGLIGKWSDTLRHLLEHTRAQCAAMSTPLPPGYYKFRATLA